VRLLKIKEVADLLAVSTRTVERLKKDGKLPPHVLVLGAHRWRSDEIEAYMRSEQLRFDAEVAQR